MRNKILLIIFVSVFISSCSNNGAGYEYMPNMYRSPSLETYGKNNFFSDSLNARKPVLGTIARGNLSSFNFDGSLVTNGSTPLRESDIGFTLLVLRLIKLEGQQLQLVYLVPELYTIWLQETL